MPTCSLAKKIPALIPARDARAVCFNVSTGIPNSMHAENLKATTLYIAKGHPGTHLALHIVHFVLFQHKETPIEIMLHQKPTLDKHFFRLACCSSFVCGLFAFSI